MIHVLWGKSGPVVRAVDGPVSGAQNEVEKEGSLRIERARAIYHENMNKILYFDAHGPSSFVSKIDFENMVLCRVVVVIKGATKPEKDRGASCGGLLDQL